MSDNGQHWTPHARVYQGHVLEVLAQIPDESVQCVVTSPPYWGLRDYGLPDSDWPEVRFQPVAGVDAEVVVEPWRGQLGLEACPWAYVAHLVAIFREVRRVLRADGTLWLNLGDCYARNGGKRSKDGSRGATSSKRMSAGHFVASAKAYRPPKHLKPKDLVGIPWRVAMALQADGWWLRSDNIWGKPNPMPESVRDRTTRSHEHVFMLAKSKRYFYDHEAIKEPSTMKPQRRSKGRPADETPRPNGHPKQSWLTVARDEPAQDGGPKRNKRDVWWITPAQFPGSHYAVFPEDLVEPCVLAGTSPVGCAKCGAPREREVECICDCGAPSAPNQVVLDPFAGRGTVGAVAVRHGRNFVGIDLAGGDAEYGDMTPNGWLDELVKEHWT